MDSVASLPLYLQIAEPLAQCIRQGTLARGDKLPSVRALARQHGGWQRRLRNLAMFPRRAHVTRFIDEVVQPACQAVAEGAADLGAGAAHEEALDYIVHTILASKPELAENLFAIGHRVVHGGVRTRDQRPDGSPRTDLVVHGARCLRTGVTPSEVLGVHDLGERHVGDRVPAHP